MGTERGQTAAPETRAEINELVIQLEAVTPHESPTEEHSIGGRWSLVYTSNIELVSVLSLAHLPFVKALELHQSIDCAASTVENDVSISLPSSSVSIRSVAAFRMQSSKRFGLYFDQSKSGHGNLQVTAHVANHGTDPAFAAISNAIKPLFETSIAAVEFLRGFLGQEGQSVINNNEIPPP